ncbi:MAG TPA: lipoyl(octanoyl) transferase LipB [Oligoflexia bacterium]|nr:lipoyl(octanoyl) transferase LipB [Oligoflexia bacterium]
MQTLDLGRKNYLEAWAIQKEFVEKRAAGEIEDTLLFVEHEPVYTVGRASQSSLDRSGESADGLASDRITDSIPPATETASIHVRKLGDVPVVEVERGGKLTFHGPGQIVGYPIFHLTRRDLRGYLREMERILMSTISEQALLSVKPCPETLFLEPGQLQTGVWVRDKKLASIGIAVRKWVSFHGFALNVHTDLRYFEAVEPCGFSGSIMTSIERELGGMGDMRVLVSNLKRTLAEKFSVLSNTYHAAPLQSPEVSASV